MIYTRFGSEVTVVRSDLAAYRPWIQVKRKDGSTIICGPSDLKADGGAKEIIEACKAAPTSLGEIGF